MRNLVVVILAAFFATTITPPAQAESFELDSSHAQVGFRVQHFGVSFLRGWFGDVTGSMNYSEKLEEMSVEIVIQTSSLITSFPTRTEHALSENFLGAEEFAEIRFTSDKFTQKDDEVWVTGDLTIRGQAQKVSFPFTTLGPRQGPFGNIRLGVTGALEIDRIKAGIPFDRKMEDGTPLVGTTVEIDLSVEFIRPVSED